MDYGVYRAMGYGRGTPAYQPGGRGKLWVSGEYGLSEIWVKRESTVCMICLTCL
ncbi:hypothetical protein P691DRAFT_685970 [Macrolepiota fuliginosa MF-IS2]|uniref:Uncharacterized protein n=1 Tax=Macrolepiota fuliginosa MF-IS2 TaxID=1400762 RepID=A0A9P5WXH8_9AGAR|nr:hypothetical protein P691DRAFT_685970 [Macrolepiota fuliginosa MF-IS2]